MLDVRPATETLAALVREVRDQQLAAPTPCADTTLGDLLDHVDGFCRAFTAAATKQAPRDGRPPSKADASRLGPDWRTRIPRLLATLGEAWCDEAAWQGTTAAGGVDLPGEVAGIVALDEVIVHGWDVAVASGQAYFCDLALATAALGFVDGAVAQQPHGSPGLFGPPVPVPDDAPVLDRLLGRTGRDPSWRARQRAAGSQ